MAIEIHTDFSPTSYNTTTSIHINNQNDFIDYMGSQWEEMQKRAEEYATRREKAELSKIENRNKKLRNLIKDIHWKDRACITYWNDGTKTKALWDIDEMFDPEKAILVCMARKLYENTGLYNEVIKKYSEAGWAEHLKKAPKTLDTLKEFFTYYDEYDPYNRDEDED